MRFSLFPRQRLWTCQPSSLPSPVGPSSSIANVIFVWCPIKFCQHLDILLYSLEKPALILCVYFQIQVFQNGVLEKGMKNLLQLFSLTTIWARYWSVYADYSTSAQIEILPIFAVMVNGYDSFLDFFLYSFRVRTKFVIV